MNSGVAFFPNPLIYGPCRPLRLGDYVAYKSARRSRPCLCFLEVEQPNAPQHPMFKEETATGLPKKQTRNEQAAKQQQQSGQSRPTKKRAKPTGKRTGVRPCHKRQHSRGMSLQIVENTNTRSENKKTGKILLGRPLRPYRKNESTNRKSICYR